MMRRFLNLLGLAGAAGLAIGLMVDPALAQSFNLDLGDGSGSTTARIVQILALLTVLSLAPSILVMVTSFTRIVVVLSFLRTAIGIQGSPPSSVIISLALFLTAFVMAPTLEAAFNTGIRPLINEEINETEALQRTIVPFHKFMSAHVRDRDLKLFLDLSKSPIPEKAEDTPLRALVPAFMISELRRAFEIGFLLFVPFLVIDMVVASVLLSMGMMMLPPAVVSLPFKLIFFVLVDGWFLVAGSLVQSFGPS
jgi:flagellar biosynthetic protein FliP